MILFGAPALLLLLIVACVAAPTAPRVDTSDPEVAKRWYSVVEDHEVAHAHVRPWPLGHDGSRTITYCFEDIESYHGLNHIFELGLAKWEPAMRLSALRVAPDPTCQQEPCLCDEPDVEDGTLRIGLVQGNQPAVGSIGYKGLDHKMTPNKPRNYLRWPTDDPFFFGALAPLLMAHELGHNIGLGHEHERPDAGNYVVFDCRALAHYEEAKAAVECLETTDEPAFAAEMSIDDKMSLVCNRRDLATKYFKQALNWMVSEEYHQKKYSKDFDLKSIMLYDSTTGRAPGADSYPLLTTAGELIHIGGDADPEQAGISDLDIERVVELYTTESVESHSTPGGSKTVPQGSHSTPGKPPGKSVTKRWWSVPEEHETQPEDIRPWPPREDGSSTITYCFENKASYDSLHELLALALAKWEPATQASALTFAPDSACTQGPCLCSMLGVAEVTLRISLADPKHQQSPLSVVGYIDRIVEKPYPNMPRHYIMWPYTPRSFGPDAALVMAHELGHVIGFMHEQERPDTRKWTKFDCGALNGFEEAKKRIASIESAIEPAFTAGMSVDSRIDLVCTRSDLAHKYFPQAVLYLPRNDAARIYRVSDDFDYNSIMVYSSDVHMVPGTDRFPLLTTEGDRIITGGHQDPRRAGLSLMDIERVKKLYPRERVAPQHSAGEQSGIGVTKRWHSVGFNTGAQSGPFTAWPSSCDDSGSAPITFCYEDGAANDALGDLFAEGLSKWTTAILASGVIFAPDPACGPDYLEPCLCSRGDISEVTVHIMLARYGETWPSSTIGYTDPKTPRAFPNMPRHYILWPADAGKFKARGPLYMSHHIGSIMGLFYEHQRAIAREWLRFDCHALEDYPAAETLISSIHDEPAFTPNMYINDRVDLLHRFDLAFKYFKQAASFIPFGKDVYPTSRDFDYHSLMIHDSSSGKAPGQPNYPLVSSGYHDEVLLTGGNADPNLARPSRLDIERVKTLYPARRANAPPAPRSPFGPPGKRSVIANATQSTQACRKVAVSGVPLGSVPTVQPSGAPAANRSTKRWYSVPLEQDAPAGVKRPWPGCNDGTRTINYCFEDEASHKELAELFAKGLAKWAPAMHVSSLVFAPDTACTSELHSRCLCSTPGIEEATLRIMLTEDGSPQATAGYLPLSVAAAPGRPRHHIAWPNDPDLFGAGAHLIMAHEIGHVVGFGHEQQRPDARGKVKFDCLALCGYDEAKKKVEAIGTDEPMFTPNMSIKERMDLVCKLQKLAQKYFPDASQYPPREDDDDDVFRHSDDFDYNSIMIYDSFFGMLEGVHRFPLMTYDENIIYLDGQSNPDKAGLSKLDIERVAALYPKQQAGGVAIQPRYSNDTHVKQPTLSVVIPELVTTIVSPVPTDFPKSVKDPKAIEIARQYAADCGKRCSGALVNW